MKSSLLALTMLCIAGCGSAHNEGNNTAAANQDQKAADTPRQHSRPQPSPQMQKDTQDAQALRDELQGIKLLLASNAKKVKPLIDELQKIQAVHEQRKALYKLIDDEGGLIRKDATVKSRKDFSPKVQELWKKDAEAGYRSTVLARKEVEQQLGPYLKRKRDLMLRAEEVSARLLVIESRIKRAKSD